jgi:hypothetical protein
MVHARILSCLFFMIFTPVFLSASAAALILFPPPRLTPLPHHPYREKSTETRFERNCHDHPRRAHRRATEKDRP